MGMRPSDKNVREDEHRARRQHDEANRRLCIETVKEWSRLMERSRKPDWSPMIGVAITSGYHWLDLWCDGCRQLKSFDLRKLERHPQTTLHGLIPKLSCTNCRPSPPFAKLVRLSQSEWWSQNRPAYIPPRGPW